MRIKRAIPQGPTRANTLTLTTTAVEEEAAEEEGHGNFIFTGALGKVWTWRFTCQRVLLDPGEAAHMAFLVNSPYISVDTSVCQSAFCEAPHPTSTKLLTLGLLLPY